MTKVGRYPEAVTELAEAFGLMAVKVEAREYSLAQKNAELNRKNQELAEALRQLELQIRMKEVMSRFVPQSVQARIEANPLAPGLEREERDVTVMFLDVGNYTGLSAQLDPAETSELIEAYFSSFIDQIHAGGGDINETAGDGLMVIFQDEDSLRHAMEAVGVALEVRERVAALNAARSALHPPVAINMGINSGRALVGSTRIRGTGSDRWTYTASGMVTNVAARLCKLASAGAILVSAETARRVSGRF
ncbi:MAG: adenylate/guanylate cyclase domain-containing protein, partial [Verrucomicrobiia bacterium]